MKRFSFSLDRVRALRQEQLEAEEMRLAGLYAALKTILDQRSQVAVERRHAEISTDRGCPAEMIQLAQFRRYLSQREQAIGLREKEQRAQMETQRIRLLEARRQHHLLDELRQKQFMAWRAACDKEQEELAAELFLARRKSAHAGNGGNIQQHNQ
jgi:flagellar biosynthesis chaperone FliJ